MRERQRQRDRERDTHTERAYEYECFHEKAISPRHCGWWVLRETDRICLDCPVNGMCGQGLSILNRRALVWVIYTYIRAKRH